ncbi:DUF86 domain-containing protein [Yoonia sp. R2-816]|uniref:HepT-like ribonuclease domain-containing protein n=1 Tax=Yoonia sp. R2-816 TaxID=3342638 RepID=UPI00372CE6C3
MPDYIEQMVRGASDAVSFTDGMDEASFMDDLKTQRAVIMSLMIVGEAASRVVAEFPDFTQENRSIPWRSIRGMRNRIAHGYFEVDLQVVWQTVEAELAPLIKRLKEISN